MSAGTGESAEEERNLVPCDLVRIHFLALIVVYLSIKLKYPSLDQFIESNFESGDEKDNINNTLSMITSCIDMIYNEEESWSGSDSTKKELGDFIDQLNTKQFKMIEDFFTTMPKLSHKVKVTNPQTKVESEVLLEGLAAFFS